jgi:hypothetical protein
VTAAYVQYELRACASPASLLPPAPGGRPARVVAAWHWQPPVPRSGARTSTVPVPGEPGLCITDIASSHLIFPVVVGTGTDKPSPTPPWRGGLPEHGVRVCIPCTRTYRTIKTPKPNSTDPGGQTSLKISSQIISCLSHQATSCGDTYDSEHRYMIVYFGSCDIHAPHSYPLSIVDQLDLHGCTNALHFIHLLPAGPYAYTVPRLRDCSIFYPRMHGNGVIGPCLRTAAGRGAGRKATRGGRRAYYGAYGCRMATSCESNHGDGKTTRPDSRSASSHPLHC